jgi:hypothetical protein
MKQSLNFSMATLAVCVLAAGLISSCGGRVEVDGAALLSAEPEPSGEIITDPAAEHAQGAGQGGAAQVGGGGCIYGDLIGTSAIVKVVTADSDENNCPNDPVAVTFQFTPDDSGATGSESKLTIGDGKNPPRSWVKASGLVEGSVHKCVRRDIVEGACAPVVYDFPDLDQEKGRADCFAKAQ